MKEIKLPGMIVQYYEEESEYEYERGSKSDCETETALIIAGGREPEIKWLCSLYENIKPQIVYCADHGLDSAYAAGIVPQAVFGDGDSANPLNWKQTEEAAKRKEIILKKFPAAKDATDLQLTLNYLPHTEKIVATGVWGGRFDHLLSVVYSLVGKGIERKIPVVLTDHEETAIFAKTGTSLQISLEKQPLAVSVLPLTEVATVSLSGVRWPLENEQLHQLKLYTVSNEALENKKIKLKCHSGYCLLYVKS